MTATCQPTLHPKPDTAPVRVLIALDMLLDRNAMSQAMAILRPTWQVREVAPHDLTQALRDDRPDVVICSELTDSIAAQARMWFMLHPYGSQRCVVGVDGRRMEELNMAFDAILRYIDRAHD